MSPGAGRAVALGPLVTLGVVLLVLGLGAPVAAEDVFSGAPGKIGFALGGLDAEGLYGPPDGRRALHYEFCIPDRDDATERVRTIDASVRTHRARGRIGCAAGQLLCLGSTHQPGYRDVLLSLAALPWVSRVEQAFFE